MQQPVQLGHASGLDSVDAHDAQGTTALPLGYACNMRHDCLHFPSPCMRGGEKLHSSVIGHDLFEPPPDDPDDEDDEESSEEEEEEPCQHCLS
jgi:hypothetical protein